MGLVKERMVRRKAGAPAKHVRSPAGVGKDQLNEICKLNEVNLYFLRGTGKGG